MHRVQHVFAGERVQAFSDAVFAIVATIMVIPLKLDRTAVEHEGYRSFELESYLLNQYPKYFIYVFSFIVVVDTWYSHVKIFSIIEHVDDVIVWLNLVLLLFVSFLPFGVGLVSNFQESRPEGFHLAIFTSSLSIMLIGITMIIILFYGYRRKAYLNPEFANCDGVRQAKFGLYLSLLVNPVLALLALALSFLPDETAALVFFYSIGTSSFLVRLAIYIYHMWRKTDMSEHNRYLFRTVASKVRTEAFSDGIFSIVATLIVLDLTTQDLPTRAEVRDKGGLRAVLYAERNVFVSYITTFLIVGLFWQVHHSMLQFIRKITPTLSVVNTLVLLLVSVIPFVAGVNIVFAEDSAAEFSENGVVSVQAVTIIVFLGGVSQLLFWAVAWIQKKDALSEEAYKYPADILQFCKIMVFPFMSFIIFWATLSDGITLHHVYNGMMISTPFMFLLINIWFKSLNKLSKRMFIKLKERHHSDRPKQKDDAVGMEHRLINND